MYGKDCVGVTYDGSIGALISDMIQAARDCDSNGEALDVLQGALQDLREDSLGLSRIVYFPNEKWVEDSEEEGDQEEDE